jgi:hypothetical protein
MAGQVTPQVDSSSVAVEAPDGSNVLVFRTTNPLIDIVWIYQGE